jgi:thioredoxin 1
MTIKHLDEFNFYNTLANTQGISLIFFTGIHCGSCHHLRQILEHYEQVFGNITIYEIDAGVSAGLTKSYEVFHLPTMFLFRDGNFHCQLHAEPLPEKIHQAIEEALLKPAGEEP